MNSDIDFRKLVYVKTAAVQTVRFNTLLLIFFFKNESYISMLYFKTFVSEHNVYFFPSLVLCYNANAKVL